MIDFQNDFTPGGALAVEHGDEIAERINDLAASGRFEGPFPFHDNGALID